MGKTQWSEDWPFEVDPLSPLMAAEITGLNAATILCGTQSWKHSAATRFWCCGTKTWHLQIRRLLQNALANWSHMSIGSSAAEPSRKCILLTTSTKTVSPREAAILEIIPGTPTNPTCCAHHWRRCYSRSHCLQPVAIQNLPICRRHMLRCRIIVKRNC